MQDGIFFAFRSLILPGGYFSQKKFIIHYSSFIIFLSLQPFFKKQGKRTYKINYINCEYTEL